MKILKYLLCASLLWGIIGVRAQSQAVPAFYLEMHKPKPNVFVVDSLYGIYRDQTPNDLDPEAIALIKKEKKQAKPPKSAWLAHAKEENTPIKKEFRSVYEKEYLEWRKEVQPYINAQGFVEFPTEAELNNSFYEKPKSKIRRRRSLSTTSASIYDSETVPYHATFSGWHYYGPVQMLSNTGEPTSTHQANVRAFAQSPTNPNYTVCAVESGTVYISHSKGKMWHLATRNYDVREVTALSFLASDENVILAGSGKGLYTTRDGGITWAFHSDFNQLKKYAGIGNNISKIISIPTDGNPLNDKIFMATNRGLIKVTQTGSASNISYTYEVKLPLCVTDVIKRPNHDNELYALAYDSATHFMYFYKSTDGGETWERKGTNGNGWYEPTTRMNGCSGARLAIAPSDDQVVYAYIIAAQTSADNAFWGVYRSNDAGEHWTLPNPNGPGAGANGYSYPENINLATFPWVPKGAYTQGFYNCAIIVSAKDPNTFIVGGLNAYISRNGGQSFERFGGYSGPKQLHPDMQTFYQQINPDGTVDTWLSTDGGINYSTDFFETENIVRTSGLGGDYWGFDLGEYHTNMGGGMYHNGDSYHVETYGKGVFKHLGGGENTTGYVLPGDDERHFVFSDYSGITASADLHTTYSGNYKLDPMPFEPYAGGDIPYYTQRDLYGNMYYFAQSKEEKEAGKFGLYLYSYKENGVRRIKQMDIEPKTEPQQYMVAFSNPLYQYLTANNKLYASVDGGATWTERTAPFPRNINIAISDKDPKTLYALFRYGWNDMLKVSHDGGQSWESISSPDPSLKYRHIINVRGTDVIFLFGNNRSKVFYYIDGQWKEYSEDLPFNLNILEPKIQYRTGEFYMATSGAGIWTRKLPQEVLEKMSAIEVNIEAPARTSFIKEFEFKPKNISLYYGKNIVKRAWEFPGASQVRNADTDTPSVVYNKFGRFSAKLTLTDEQGQSYTETFPEYFTVYPYCACDTPEVLKDLLGKTLVWVDAANANLDNASISDKITGKSYTFANAAQVELEQSQELSNGHKTLHFKAQNSYIDLGKTYQGKTFFIVSKLDPNTSNSFSFLLGAQAGVEPHFHSGGKLGAILSTRPGVFNPANGGVTMINGLRRNFFNTNFYTNGLAVYALRVDDANASASVRYISKDRGFGNRTWIGNIAEVIILDEKLDLAQIQQINQYLIDKYGIATRPKESDLPNSISGLVARVSANHMDWDNQVIEDPISGSGYTLAKPNFAEMKTAATGQKLISIQPNREGASIQLDQTYQGKTFFIVSKLNPNTTSNFSFLLGSESAADFHSNGALGPIFSGWMSDRNRFDPANGGATMINNKTEDFFTANFKTDKLALYTVRVADNKAAAKVGSIAKDRGFNDRIWQGEIGEVLIYDRQLTDEEIAQINQYLMQKFGIVEP